MEGSQLDGSNHGVIWITGYSAAGKTTVGRKVEANLKSLGQAVIFLDGDDLRSIFSAKWGYERNDRVELARVYFRLASHLAAQGYAVVVSAVAMYEEASRWLSQNVPGALQILLNVPEEERLKRDAATKGVYSKIGNPKAMYDELSDVVAIDNFGVEPDLVADKIVQLYLSRDNARADFGRNRHWGSYYAADEAPVRPSPFAEHVEPRLARGTKLLEVGCGNGRDSLFFSRNGHDVTAIDMSTAAIESCKARNSQVAFHAGTLADVGREIPGDFDAVYSRFVIHAMPLVEEEELLDGVRAVLKLGGHLYIECRSINDPMARLGEVISPTERIHGHYRRFIIMDDFKARLQARDLEIVDAVESAGLAVHGTEDPVVIRVTAKKN